ncbi:hypothetical protein TEA_007261 [Camellia sinensis var. sinensis]|uniref:Dof zinc finger protein n=1 Tax=Camellia sinensis var. sinensis TaxID=542762 RepID=A0A4V3WJJ0_CAMSN|nr:hypothetical protein TEA_007261 [Camellia sinensis var. sinensis]
MKSWVSLALTTKSFEREKSWVSLLRQQQNPQIGTSSGNGNPHLPPPPLPPPPYQGDGSVADRARMASIPMPEAALKCPRCESTNTKFCYFNNYSLTQPRHFCKTCQRYWTRGRALRSVPVGGGCRRKKRSKGSNSSKSPVSGGGGDGQTSNGSTSAISSSTSVGTASLLAPLVVTSDMNMNFHLGSSSLGLDGCGGGGSEIEQWRLQQPTQISLMAGLDFPGVLYPFQGGVEPSGYGGEGSQVRPKPPGLGFTTHQLGSVKMEDNQVRELNLSRQFLGIPGNDQYWSGSSSAWTDLSGFSSSSTRNPL